jgi:hypothetical protein
MGVNHYARGVVGFFLNPTNKGPKGIADMGCARALPPPAELLACMHASCRLHCHGTAVGCRALWSRLPLHAPRIVMQMECSG